ncbi:substrate-binding domain-containing protein [Aeromicrobium sp.]|uniref:sugar ABC transporter substrate-binding protein n=1 Tax=Aeromicrobium sp. TaxID=1871063 RepID=UPI0019A844C6|nr:substrate-binding domain-containing protein [Aeromicrobium sp.]MBC7632679.1 sugar ABC transporter substrate-binding protein [Aeromicrobium sp.]
MAFAITFTATACGGNADTGRSAQQAATQRPNAQQEAAAAIEPFLAPPTDIPVNTPLAKKPAGGKTIIISEDPAAVSRKTNDGFEVGAKMLGWTVKRQPIGTGPEDAAKAFDAALDQKPDAINMSGHAASTLRAQVDRAKNMGIPVLLTDVSDPVGSDGLVHVIGIDDASQTGPWGTMSGDYAVSQGAKNVLVVDLSFFPALHAYSESVANRVGKLGGKATIIDTTLTEFVGGKIPARVVSEIQRNPNIDWVLMCLGDMSTGLNAALKGAGFADKVKVGGETASTANVSALKAGTESAWTGFPAEIHGMYRVDALARILNGEPLVKGYTSLPTQMLTAKNIGTAPVDSGGYYIGIPGYREYFAKLWKL